MILIMSRPTLTSLAEKYGEGSDPVSISFGFRPSGTIHLGNMMTMALAAGLAERIGPHRAGLNVTVCDLDLPDSSDWSVHTHGFAKHYRDLPSPNGGAKSMSEFTTAQVEKFLRSLQSYTGVPYQLKTLTDVQREPAFRQGLKRVLDNPESMALINPDMKDNSVLVFPLCPECDTSYTGTAKGKKNTYRDGKVHTYCTNPGCKIEEYEVDVLDTARDLSVHMFIDPLRDAVVKPFADVHVFGGDYLDNHGSNNMPKADKISRIIQIAAAEGVKVPDILVGPTIYARDGAKMSKRTTNGLDMNSLSRYLGENYPEEVLKFTMAFVGKGHNHIEYPLVAEHLIRRID